MLTRMVSISWPRDPPASASQSAGIIGMSHCAQPISVSFNFPFIFERHVCWLQNSWMTGYLFFLSVFWMSSRCLLAFMLYDGKLVVNLIEDCLYMMNLFFPCFHDFFIVFYFNSLRCVCARACACVCVCMCRGEKSEYWVKRKLTKAVRGSAYLHYKLISNPISCHVRELWYQPGILGYCCWVYLS